MPLTSAISAHSPLRIWSSAWLRPNALTSITAWPALGSGSGISRMTSTSGPPNPVLRIARMRHLPHRSVMGRAAQGERGQQVDFQHLPEVLQRRVKGGAAEGCAHVVYQAVDAADAAAHPGDDDDRCGH